MGFKNYIKRGIKYVVKDYNPPVTKIEVVQKSASNIFKDKVVLITGGGSGIGFQIAKKFLEENAKVIITGRDEQKLKNTCDELKGDISYYCFDISNIDKGQNMIEDIFNKYGKIDILINNAGISLHEGNILKVTEEDFDNQISTNLKGGYFLSQKYINKTLENKLSGNIIFISSERGSQCDDLPYGLTKIAINSLTKALSIRYYKEGIRVNAVAPGVTATNMTGIEKNQDMYSPKPSGRFFVPEEIAEVVAFLASDYSKCISGEVIHCNAGNHLQLGFKNKNKNK